MGSLEARCLEGFTDLCRKLEAEYDLDYILIDLPPTSSPGNGHIICCCDALAMPCECDGASWEAVRDSLAQLVDFKASYEVLRLARTATAARDCARLPTDFQQPCRVKLLGTMQSNFNVEDGVNSPYIHSEYAFWMRKIDAEVKGLIGRLRDAGLAFPEARYSAAGIHPDCLCLSRTPNFYSLDSMAQRAGKTVATLSEADLINRDGKKISKSPQKGNAHNRVAKFTEVPTACAHRVIKLLDPGSGVCVEMEGPVPDHRTAEPPKAQKRRHRSEAATDAAAALA